MEICFALCSNRRYFPGLRLTLASALLSSSQYAFYKVWIMHSDYTETEIDALRHIAGRTKRRVEIRFIEINENRFHGLNRQTNGSLLAYAPFLLSEYIDEARIFFIDCDLIVVNPLETFYNIDLKGNCIMGVVDRWMTHLKDDCPFPISKEEECLPYINTGFLLIDLVAWKKNNYNEQFLEILKAREPKLNYFDQTLINYLCRGNILEGSSSLNGLIWREDGLALFCCNNRVLSNLHFVTQPKPWMEASFTTGSSIWWEACSLIFGAKKTFFWKLKNILGNKQILRDTILSFFVRIVFLKNRFLNQKEEISEEKYTNNVFGRFSYIRNKMIKSHHYRDATRRIKVEFSKQFKKL